MSSPRGGQHQYADKQPQLQQSQYPKNQKRQPASALVTPAPGSMVSSPQNQQQQQKKPTVHMQLPKNKSVPTGKTDFMQTQTFHRRNMSNLINMNEEEDVPDHMLISRGGPPRRTLEQIEQGSNYAYGEEESPNDEMMDSQESAAENDFRDLNSNNLQEDEPEMPKGGFFNMVEHPSILDDHDESDEQDVQDDIDEDQTSSRREQEQRTSDNAQETDPYSNDEFDEQENDEMNGDFPMTDRKIVSNLRLDSAGDHSPVPFGQSVLYADNLQGLLKKKSGHPTKFTATPDGQKIIVTSPHPYDSEGKMELSDLQYSRKRQMELGEVAREHSKSNSNQQQVSDFPRQPQGQQQRMSQSTHLAPNITNNQHQYQQHNYNQMAPHIRASPLGGEISISQATNESCSSMDTMGQLHNGSTQKDWRAQAVSTPNQAYGQYERHSQQQPSGGLQQFTKTPQKEVDAQHLQVYQYYQNNEGDEDDTDSLDRDDDEKDHNDETGLQSNSSPSQLINTASPSPVKQDHPKVKQPKKKFFQDLQIEIDSDQEANGRQGTQQAPPSAPKQSNFIQFEEVQDVSQQHDEVRREDAYQIYGGKMANSSAGTPGQPREQQQISSQKMLTPNEQRMHQSYFPHETALRQAMPSTKSYQTPITYSHNVLTSSANSKNVANPFTPADKPNNDANGANKSLHYEETNSVSTTNPQYYYMKQNGQIGFSQNSQSRASDRIYEKAHQTSLMQGMSPGDSHRQNDHDDSLQQYAGDDSAPNRQSVGNIQNVNNENNQNDKIETEIRRLEELNAIDAQRLREPATASEESPTSQEQKEEEDLRRLQEEETKANCPDEYNLLSCTISGENVDSVEALRNVSGDVVAQIGPNDQSLQQKNTKQQQVQVMKGAQETNNEDLNDRESLASGGGTSDPTSQNNAMRNPSLRSFGTSNAGDRNSRRLYVITEESQSMAGQTVDPSRVVAGEYNNFINHQPARSSGAPQQNMGYGFLKASNNSQELPLYDPQSRRLTHGSSNRTENDRSSMLLESTPIDGTAGRGSIPKKQLNQTMQLQASPQIQTFNEYCKDQNENSASPEQQFISMAQINPSAEVSHDEEQAILQQLHQRSKSQQNAVVASSFLNQKQDSQSPDPHNQYQKQQQVSARNNKLSTNTLPQFNSQSDQDKDQNVSMSKSAQQSAVKQPSTSPFMVQQRNLITSQTRVPLHEPLIQSAGPTNMYRSSGNNGENQLNAMQNNLHSSTFQRDQDLMSAYLKQTSTVTAERRNTAGSNFLDPHNLMVGSGVTDPNKPFEMASDEDLLNSNFDRISKILPNHEQINEQLPDFHPEESVSPARAFNEKEQMLLGQIEQLRQTLIQRDQVIMIKDNTIADLKNEFGYRNSILGGTSNMNADETRNVAVLARPDTKDVKCQTHGPRKNAYYRSIPAKVFTNLNGRSASLPQERDPSEISVRLRRHQSYKAPNIPEGSPMKKKSTLLSNSQSPSLKQSLRKLTPDKEMGRGNIRLDNQAAEDMKSLRLQLMSLKKQLNAQEQDNRLLIEKVTHLEEIIETQEKNYDALYLQLEERNSQLENFKSQNEELQKQVDSLAADNAELLHSKSLSLKSSLRLIQEKRAESAVEYGMQTDELLWQDYISQQIRTRQQTLDGSYQQMANANDTTQNNDQMASISARSSVPQSNHNHHLNNKQASSGQPSMLLAPPLGNGLFPSQHNSRILDQLSSQIDVSGEQGAAEYERMQLLVERARSYEQQQTRIEQEISQYQKLLQEVQMSQQHPQPQNAQLLMPSSQLLSLASGLASGHSSKNINDQHQHQLLQHQQNSENANAAQQQMSLNSARGAPSDILNISDMAMAGTKYVGNQQPATIQSFNHLHHQRQTSNISQVSASPINNNNMLGMQDYQNTQDYLKSGGTMSFEFNKNTSQNLGLGMAPQGIGVNQNYQTHQQQNAPQQYAYATGANSSGIVSMVDQQHQTLAYMQQKMGHHKRKSKKLVKKNQKLEFEKMQSDQMVKDMDSKMQELSEKYRDLRAKYQLKLQEKNIKISDLKAQLQRDRHYLGMANSQARTNANSMIGGQMPQAFQIHSSQLQHPGGLPQMTSYGELSTNNLHHQQQTQPLTPNLSDDLPRTSTAMMNRMDTSQEDNKGQTKNTAFRHRQQQRAERSPLHKHSMPAPEGNSISIVQGPAAAEKAGDFYRIVSGMVDQRIAEQSLEDETTSKRHQTNKGDQFIYQSNEYLLDKKQQKKQKQQMDYLRKHQQQQPSANRQHTKNNNYPEKPDLTILRASKSKSRKNDDSPTQGHTMLLESQNLVSSPEGEKEFINFRLSEVKPPSQHDNSDINDRTALLEQQQLWYQGQQQQLQLRQLSRNTGPTYHQTQKDTKTTDMMFTNLPRQINDKVAEAHNRGQVAKKQQSKQETLAESYLTRKMRGNDRTRRQSQECSPLSSPSPDRQTRHTQQQKLPSKSFNNIRDNSVRSVVSKDDVMPCYKYKVDGRKRNHVEYQPPISLMSYMATNPMVYQQRDENNSSAGNQRQFSSSSSPVRKYSKNIQQRQGSSQETSRRQDAHPIQQHGRLQQQQDISLVQQNESKIGQMLRVAQLNMK